MLFSYFLCKTRQLCLVFAYSITFTSVSDLLSAGILTRQMLTASRGEPENAVATFGTLAIKKFAYVRNRRDLNH